MNLAREYFLDDAERIGCSVSAVMAVAEVESSGGGFNPDSSPKTLFEGHWFHRYTRGVYDAQYPDISYPKWTKQFYGHTWEAEQDRLNRAIALDERAAMLSASWGMFQVMGFNFAICNYQSVESFVESMRESEDAQLAAFTNYVIQNGLADELQRLDWDGFAYRYNGPEYQKNHYAQKLANAYNYFVGLGY